jgi:hypothetical protein
MDTRSFLSGIAIGAAVALVFDPGRGGRRRALVRDKMARAGRATGEIVDTTMRDLANRTRGFVFETRGWLTEGDARLLKRVRARLGRATSHPRAIDVAVQEGQVILRGPILAAEVHDLLSTVARVRGVQSVLNELDAHDSAEHVSALQGGTRRDGDRFDLMQRTWAPATRALAGAAALAASGLVVAYARR